MSSVCDDVVLRSGGSDWDDWLKRGATYVCEADETVVALSVCVENCRIVKEVCVEMVFAEMNLWVSASLRRSSVWLETDADVKKLE